MYVLWRSGNVSPPGNTAHDARHSTYIFYSGIRGGFTSASLGKKISRKCDFLGGIGRGGDSTHDGPGPTRVSPTGRALGGFECRSPRGSEWKYAKERGG